jgi:hypothetical protein
MRYWRPPHLRDLPTPERTSALRARVARQPAMTLRPAAVIFTTNICVAPPPTLRVGELLTKLLYLWVAG